MSASVRLGLIILGVSDVARATRFYRDAFDWPQEVDTPVYVEFRLPAGMRFGVYDRASFAMNTGQSPNQVPPGALTATEVYLYPDDLADTASRLARSGARMLSPLAPRSWGDEAVYYADLDGNVLVLARPMRER